MPYLWVVEIAEPPQAGPLVQFPAQGWKIGLYNSIKMYRAKGGAAHQSGNMVVYTRVVGTAFMQVLPADFPV